MTFEEWWEEERLQIGYSRQDELDAALEIDNYRICKLIAEAYEAGRKSLKEELIEMALGEYVEIHEDDLREINNGNRRYRYWTCVHHCYFCCIQRGRWECWR